MCKTLKLRNKFHKIKELFFSEHHTLAQFCKLVQLGKHFS